MTASRARFILAIILASCSAVGGLWTAVRTTHQLTRTHIVAFFQNSNGVFVGDDVRIRGVTVGSIESIEPEPTRVKISFWIDDTYRVPADAKAVILSPTLVTARAIQLTPPYRGGPALSDRAVIPETRTAVPVEWDDFRGQLQRLTAALQPDRAGGVSALGALVNSTADNLHGQGPAIRDAVLKLSQALSALGDHSGDIFTTVKNLSTLVSALQSSTTLMRQLNRNLASVTALLVNDPDQLGNALSALNTVLPQIQTFVHDNRDTIGQTSDRLTSVTQAITDSLGDLKQLLHVAPTSIADLVNTYQPAQGTLSGVLAANNFSNPISFLCGAIQAASRLNADQSSKLCVQYLAPIVKNRQYNFPPLGFNPIVGPAARPNEITYSEDWMRPDAVPPAPRSNPQRNQSPLPAEAGSPLHTTAVDTPTGNGDPQHGNQGTGLAGLMMPGGGS